MKADITEIRARCEAVVYIGGNYRNEATRNSKAPITAWEALCLLAEVERLEKEVEAVRAKCNCRDFEKELGSPAHKTAADCVKALLDEAEKGVEIAVGLTVKAKAENAKLLADVERLKEELTNTDAAATMEAQFADEEQAEVKRLREALEWIVAAADNYNGPVVKIAKEALKGDRP